MTIVLPTQLLQKQVTDFMTLGIPNPNLMKGNCSIETFTETSVSSYKDGCLKALSNIGKFENCLTIKSLIMQIICAIVFFLGLIHAADSAFHQNWKQLLLCFLIDILCMSLYLGLNLIQKKAWKAEWNEAYIDAIGNEDIIEKHTNHRKSLGLDKKDSIAVLLLTIKSKRIPLLTIEENEIVEYLFFLRTQSGNYFLAPIF